MDHELNRRIAERRADPEFRADLDRLIDENREVLERLGRGEQQREIWTAEQEEMWQLYGGRPPVPSGDQTREQAFNFAVGGFMRVCDFEGVEPPPQDAVEARMRVMAAWPEFRVYVTVPGIPADDEDRWTPLARHLELQEDRLGPILGWTDNTLEIITSMQAEHRASAARIAVEAVAKALVATGLGDHHPSAVQVEPASDRVA